MPWMGVWNKAERSCYDDIRFSVKSKKVRQPLSERIPCGIKLNAIHCKLNIGCICSNQSIHSNGNTHTAMWGNWSGENVTAGSLSSSVTHTQATPLAAAQIFKKNTPTPAFQQDPLPKFTLTKQPISQPTHLLHGNELFSRGHQLYTYSRPSQHFIAPEDSFPCS
jgi:hypothetical protein